MSKKGRYWVFAYNGFYPLGGLNDYQFSFNTVSEFEEYILESKFDTYQLLDRDNNYSFNSDLGTLISWVCKNIGGEVYE